MPQTILKPNDVYAFVGKRGSGKSVGAIILACEIIPRELKTANGWETWFVNTKDDPKDVKMCRDWGFEDFDPFARPNPLNPFNKKQTSARRIINIPFTENTPELTVAKMNYICHLAMRRKCVLLIVDEYTHVVPSSRNAGPGLKHVFQRGRGRLVGIIGCTQEPVDVPRQLLSQASHIFLFALTYPADIKRVQEIYKFYNTPKHYGFYQAWIDTPDLVTWRYWSSIGEWDTNCDTPAR